MSRSRPFDAVPAQKKSGSKLERAVEIGFWHAAVGAAWGAMGGAVFDGPMAVPAALGAAYCVGARLIGGPKVTKALIFGGATVLGVAGAAIAFTKGAPPMDAAAFKDMLKVSYTFATMALAFGAVPAGMSSSKPAAALAPAPAQNRRRGAGPAVTL